jgi:hypothetical protein
MATNDHRVRHPVISVPTAVTDRLKDFYLDELRSDHISPIAVNRDNMMHCETGPLEVRRARPTPYKCSARNSRYARMFFSYIAITVGRLEYTRT